MSTGPATHTISSADLDESGYASYRAILGWVEQARESFLSGTRLGTDELAGDGIGLVVRSIEIRFFHALQLGDSICTSIEPTAVKRASLRLRFQASSPRGPAAEGTFHCAFVHLATLKPFAPDPERLHALRCKAADARVPGRRPV